MSIIHNAFSPGVNAVSWCCISTASLSHTQKLQLPCPITLWVKPDMIAADLCYTSNESLLNWGEGRELMGRQESTKLPLNVPCTSFFPAGFLGLAFRKGRGWEELGHNGTSGCKPLCLLYQATPTFSLLRRMPAK